MVTLERAAFGAQRGREVESRIAGEPKLLKIQRFSLDDALNGNELGNRLRTLVCGLGCVWQQPQPCHRPEAGKRHQAGTAPRCRWYVSW